MQSQNILCTLNAPFLPQHLCIQLRQDVEKAPSKGSSSWTEFFSLPIIEFQWHMLSGYTYATEAFRDSVPTVQYMLLSIVCSSVHGRELATETRGLA